MKKIRSKKISYTHIIGWAIVKALKKFPVMNYSFSTIEGEPFVIKKSDVNIGLAIDIEKKDGSRSLIVPNIKKSSEMNFKQYFDAYNDIIDRSRKNKIEVGDFLGTTISLTNPRDDRYCIFKSKVNGRAGYDNCDRGDRLSLWFSGCS